MRPEVLALLLFGVATVAIGCFFEALEPGILRSLGAAFRSLFRGE